MINVYLEVLLRTVQWRKRVSKPAQAVLISITKIKKVLFKLNFYERSYYKHVIVREI